MKVEGSQRDLHVLVAFLCVLTMISLKKVQSFCGIWTLLLIGVKMGFMSPSLEGFNVLLTLSRSNRNE